MRFNPRSRKILLAMTTKPTCLELVLCDMRNHCRGKTLTLQHEQLPLSATRESPHTATKTQHSQEKWKKKKRLVGRRKDKSDKIICICNKQVRDTQNKKMQNMMSKTADMWWEIKCRIVKMRLNLRNQHICTPTFTSALFTITNIWRQFKCSSINEWINIYIYSVCEYIYIYSVCICIHTQWNITPL